MREEKSWEEGEKGEIMMRDMKATEGLVAQRREE